MKSRPRPHEWGKWNLLPRTNFPLLTIRRKCKYCHEIDDRLISEDDYEKLLHRISPL